MDGVGGLMEVKDWAGQGGARNVADAGCQLIAGKIRCRPINKGLGAAPHTLPVACLRTSPERGRPVD
jgi:hypothetical protein